MNFKRILFSLAITAACFASVAQPIVGFSPETTLQHIRFLASEELKGRKSGTPEAFIAADYIRSEFLISGAQLMGDGGFQQFEIITGISLGLDNALQIKEQTFEIGEDFTPLPFSKNGFLTAEAIFVGYGLEISNDSVKWNDYSGVDIKGKWAVMLRGEPKSENGTALVSGNFDERFKVMIAQDHGAAGVIFVSGEQLDSEDNLLKLTYDKSPATSGIPVIQIKRKVIDAELSTIGRNIADLESEIAMKKQPVTTDIPVTISSHVDLVKDLAAAYNVIAMIEGQDEILKDQFIVIGAHYDHLGLGGFGSGSRVPDTVAVHYGADDNASGVAGIIELAKHFSKRENLPQRSLVFVAFDAEEMGLIGSRFFVNNPLIDLKNVNAMINFDMIGRLKESNTISIGGTGTSLETEDILNQLAGKYPLTLSYSAEGFGPSDHAAFYAKNIPVFFISTGAHADYHTPRDNETGINADGMVNVLDFGAALISELSDRPEMLTFQEAGPSSRSDHRYNFKVTLGIMPDMTSSGNDGLRVEAVRPGAPAASGGMRKGDIITAIDGNPVGNIYDYMGRLKNLEAGQVISVDVIRDSKHEVLIIQL
ncbi:MAG: M28 family peptidase [Bacteroidales bacterium]|nr:M28 family peptidase [Bacteroidales bacterium]